MLPAMLQSWRRRAAAGALGILVLAAPGTAAVAAARAEALGLSPIVGELIACVTPGGVGSSVPGDPVSTLALASGDFLFVRWGEAGWGLLWLSRDGRALRRVEADVPTGRVTGAVRLADDRVLVTAEEGLFLFDGDRRLERIANCDKIGMAQFFARNDGGVLAFSDGSLLLAGERGLLRLSPQGRLERLGEIPDGASAVEIVGGNAVLVSGVFGHYLVTHDGRTIPVATGTRAQSYIAVRGSKPEVRSAPSRVESLSFGNSAPPPLGMALMDTGGQTTWAIVPDDVRSLSHPIDLGEGRFFWISDRGLLRLRGDGTMQLVSAGVRLACGDAGADDVPTLLPLADGRTLVLAGGLLFTIDRKDRVRPIVKQTSCTGSLRKNHFAATNDGSIYFDEKDVLHRADAGGRALEIVRTAKTGTIYSVKSYGDDVLVDAKEGLFHTRRGRSLNRVVPKDHDANVLYNSDIDGRPLICIDKSALHRLDPQGVLQPLSAAAGIRCGSVTTAGSLGLLMWRDEKSHVLITRDDQSITVPGARVRPVAQLRDGSAILMTLPAGRHESWWDLDRDEESTLPHALIRVSPDGRIEPVAFDGPEIEMKPLRDPTWQERSQIRAMHFTNPTRGWAVLGERGILAASADAGAQWRGVTANDEPIVGLASLSFTADGRHGLAAGKDALW